MYWQVDEKDILCQRVTVHTAYLQLSSYLRYINALNTTTTNNNIMSRS